MADEYEFQSTLPRGERLNRRARDTGSRRFQSTLPRGERPAVEFPEQHHRLVSIHAPAGGATFVHVHFLIPLNVSIHAPAGGATSARLSMTVWRRVSIHAPAGGATVGGVRGWEGGGYGWGFAKDVFRGLYSMDFKGDFMQWAEGQRARMVGGLCNTPGSQPYDTGPTI